jgi:hypothetical protein
MITVYKFVSADERTGLRGMFPAISIFYVDMSA